MNRAPGDSEGTMQGLQQQRSRVPRSMSLPRPSDLARGQQLPGTTALDHLLLSRKRGQGGLCCHMETKVRKAAGERGGLSICALVSAVRPSYHLLPEPMAAFLPPRTPVPLSVIQRCPITMRNGDWEAHGWPFINICGGAGACLKGSV